MNEYAIPKYKLNTFVQAINLENVFWKKTPVCNDIQPKSYIIISM